MRHRVRPREVGGLRGRRGGGGRGAPAQVSPRLPSPKLGTHKLSQMRFLDNFLGRSVYHNLSHVESTQFCRIVTPARPCT